MKIVKTEIMPENYNPSLASGDFNRCEHLRLEVEAGKWQTISCKLPNGKFVTFAFVPGKGNEIECVDLHTTVGTPMPRPDNDERTFFPQQLIGFALGTDTFDTRKGKKTTSLATLLLGSQHYQPKTA
jgi:hypothetical protein